MGGSYYSAGSLCSWGSYISIWPPTVYLWYITYFVILHILLLWFYFMTNLFRNSAASRRKSLRHTMTFWRPAKAKILLLHTVYKWLDLLFGNRHPYSKCFLLSNSGHPIFPNDLWFDKFIGNNLCREEW